MKKLLVLAVISLAICWAVVTVIPGVVLLWLLVGLAALGIGLTVAFVVRALARAVRETERTMEGR